MHLRSQSIGDIIIHLGCAYPRWKFHRGSDTTSGEHPKCTLISQIYTHMNMISYMHIVDGGCTIMQDCAFPNGQLIRICMAIKRNGDYPTLEQRINRSDSLYPLYWAHRSANTSPNKRAALKPREKQFSKLCSNIEPRSRRLKYAISFMNTFHGNSCPTPCLTIEPSTPERTESCCSSATGLVEYSIL